MIISVRLRNRSTQAPAGSPNRSHGNQPAAVNKAIANVPA